MRIFGKSMQEATKERKDRKIPGLAAGLPRERRNPHNRLAKR